MTKKKKETKTKLKTKQTNKTQKEKRRIVVVPTLMKQRPSDEPRFTTSLGARAFISAR